MDNDIRPEGAHDLDRDRAIAKVMLTDLDLMIRRKFEVMQGIHGEEAIVLKEKGIYRKLKTRKIKF